MTRSAGRRESPAAVAVAHPNRRPHLTVGLVGAAVAVVDGASTFWAVRNIPSTDNSVRAAAGVTLRRVSNSGAAFGLGAGHPLLVIAVSVAALAVLLGWWPRWATCRLELIAVGVVLGGALANLGDRLAEGAVTDWIHLDGYPPTFNPADICIRVGTVVALSTHLHVGALASKIRNRIATAWKPKTST